MKPTLLILAAGMGSRYGGIKQLDQFGPDGETIIDYSLYDAINSGFGKVVFIIREEIKEDVVKLFAPKLEGKIEFDFAIQSIQSYVPEELGTIERTKPWGTGHAMLCAKEYTSTPFAIINADDYYGKEAFETMAKFLSSDADNTTQHALVGYEIAKTLSENGTVSRGVCVVDDNEFLLSVTERTKIYKEGDQIVFDENGLKEPLAATTPVSMNFWGFKPSIFPIVEEMFTQYAKDNVNSPKAEFYIPTIVSHVIQQNLGSCKMFRSSSDWFGVTYPEDKPTVQAEFKKLHARQVYPDGLWK